MTYPGTRVVLRIDDVSMFGDFDDNLTLNCADVDALVAEIASGGMATGFDLNGDAVVDPADLDLWLEEAGDFNVGGAYLPGDANLDGVVDISDFNVWNGEKFTGVTGGAVPTSTPTESPTSRTSTSGMATSSRPPRGRRSRTRGTVPGGCAGGNDAGHLAAGRAT